MSKLEDEMLRKKLSERIWIVVPEGVSARDTILDGLVELFHEYARDPDTERTDKRKDDLAGASPDV